MQFQVRFPIQVPKQEPDSQARFRRRRVAVAAFAADFPARPASQRAGSFALQREVRSSKLCEGSGARFPMVSVSQGFRFPWVQPGFEARLPTFCNGFRCSFMSTARCSCPVDDILGLLDVDSVPTFPSFSGKCSLKLRTPASLTNILVHSSLVVVSLASRSCCSIKHVHSTLKKNSTMIRTL